MGQPAGPGFVLPGQNQPQQPMYPPQPGYPPAGGAGYPGYPPQQQQAQYQPPAGHHHQPFPAPIQQQPGGYISQPQQGYWFANTDFQQYLYSATSFHVKQKVELLETLVGWETPNKYTVKDQAGHKVFYVGEESDCLARQCIARYRPFTLTVKDSRGQNVIQYTRGLDCGCICFGLCCTDSMKVTSASGQLIGSVQENCGILNPSYNLKNAAGQTVLKVEGPMCPFAFGSCSPAVFRVMTPDGVSVGTISKEWSGLVRELFTDADFFSMSFPIDLDPSMKAVCLGVLFLIDYQYFESGHGGKQGGRRLFG